jgi:hypothetical protein
MTPDLETRVRRANPMTRQDQLDQIFGEEASGRLLRDIHHRKVGRMTEATKERTRTTPPPTRRRWGWLIAAATAAVTALLAGSVLIVTAVAGPDSAAPPAGMEPVAVIDSAYEALNAGDVDGWMAHYTADHFENPLLVASLHDVLAAAGQRKEMLEPCRPIGEEQVECTVRDVNDFHGAAGITITLRERFTVNEDGRISATDTTVISFTQPGYYTFTQTFWSWMEDAHPEVHAENRPVIVTHWPKEPEQIRVGLEYLDEFLAQSDLYPITDGS